MTVGPLLPCTAWQGTVDTLLNWNAAFDILLDALRTVASDFCFQYIDGFQYPTDDTASADDHLSASGTFEALQKKANIVSAFCIIFGLDIATAKLRTFHLRWGKTSTPLQRRTRRLMLLTHYLYTRDDGRPNASLWLATELQSTAWEDVPPVVLGSPLGHAIPGQGYPQPHNRTAWINFRSTYHPLWHEVKQVVLQRSEFPSLLYLMIANWPLATYRLLDIKANRLIKKMFKFPTSFPTYI